MKKTINKDIKKYCSEVKKLLACPGGIKFAFISELKNRIYEYIEEHPDDEITIKKISDKEYIYIKITIPAPQSNTEEIN